jgi:hypothetical protein
MDCGPDVLVRGQAVCEGDKVQTLSTWPSEPLNICSLLYEFSLERVTDPLYVKFVCIVDD